MLVLLIIFVLLNVGDCLSTYFALTKYGLREGNPIFSKIFKKKGLFFGLIVKMIVVIALSLFFWNIYNGFNLLFNVQNFVLTILTIANLIMFGVVTNNIFQILKKKRDEK